MEDHELLDVEGLGLEVGYDGLTLVEDGTQVPDDVWEDPAGKEHAESHEDFLVDGDRSDISVADSGHSLEGPVKTGDVVNAHWVIQGEIRMLNPVVVSILEFSCSDGKEKAPLPVNDEEDYEHELQKVYHVVYEVIHEEFFELYESNQKCSLPYIWLFWALRSSGVSASAWTSWFSWA